METARLDYIKFHLLDHVVTDLERIVCQKISDASPFDGASLRLNRAYKT